MPRDAHAALPPPPTGPNDPLVRTAVTTSDGIRIHALQTGWVAVKTAHRALRGPAGLRIPRILLDSRWTEWLPIHAWVIEHDEGLICVDTGETERTKDPDYFRCDALTGFFYNRNLRFAVRPEDEIAGQMRALGLSPGDVRWVIQTHLHSDHMGGLGAFPKAEVIVPRGDYPASQGTLPCRYPEDFSPHFPAYRSGDLAGFDRIAPVTRRDDIVILPTPGHSVDHQSVLLRGTQTDILFAGDASFDEAQLLSDEIAGICADVGDARDTIGAIRRQLAARPTVYLPTHDAAAPARLLESRTTATR